MCFDYYHILPTKVMFKPRYFITILTLIFFSGSSINAQRSLRNLIFNKECRYDSIDFAKYTSPSYRHAGLMIDRPDFDSIIANPERHYTSAMQLISSPVIWLWKSRQKLQTVTGRSECRRRLYVRWQPENG